MCGVRIKKLINLNSRAFSLVEIMVALVITSMISIAVVSLYTTGLRNFFQIKETSKQANESIVLFNLLEKDFSDLSRTAQNELQSYLMTESEALA